jgi:hypothetical protein
MTSNCSSESSTVAVGVNLL